MAITDATYRALPSGETPAPGEDTAPPVYFLLHMPRTGGTTIAAHLKTALVRLHGLWPALRAATIGLAHTEFAEATSSTLRLALLKIGALVRISVRRVVLAMASAPSPQPEFALAQARLTAAATA